MAGTEAQFQAVVDALKAAQRVCIITHLRPDADAVGSASALALGLDQLGKESTIARLKAALAVTPYQAPET